MQTGSNAVTSVLRRSLLPRCHVHGHLIPVSHAVWLRLRNGTMWSADIAQQSGSCTTHVMRPAAQRSWHLVRVDLYVHCKVACRCGRGQGAPRCTVLRVACATEQAALCAGLSLRYRSALPSCQAVAGWPGSSTSRRYSNNLKAGGRADRRAEPNHIFTDSSTAGSNDVAKTLAESRDMMS